MKRIICNQNKEIIFGKKSTDVYSIPDFLAVEEGANPSPVAGRS